jgi:hypothetical protein
MWDRWQKDESLQQIARLFDRNHSSVQGILAQSGRIRSAPRRRSSLALTLVEREEISRALASGHSTRSIAVLLESPQGEGFAHSIRRRYLAFPLFRGRLQAVKKNRKFGEPRLGYPCQLDMKAIEDA